MMLFGDCSLKALAIFLMGFGDCTGFIRKVYKSLWQTPHKREISKGRTGKCLQPGCPAALLDYLWKELVFSGRAWSYSKILKNLL